MSNQPPYGEQQGQPGNYPGAPQQGQPGYQGAPQQGQPGGYQGAPQQGQPGGYQGAPQQGYQQAPQMPGGGYGNAPAAVAKPKSIDLAVKLMYAGAVLSLLNLLSVFFVKDKIRDTITDSAKKNGTATDASTIDTAVNAAIGISIVIGLLGVLLWVLMARMNDKGKSWARIVATVLGALCVVSTFAQVAQGTATGLTLVLTIVMLLLAAAILFLLWKKESSEYYRAQSAPKL